MVAVHLDVIQRATRTALRVAEIILVRLVKFATEIVRKSAKMGGLVLPILSLAR